MKRFLPSSLRGRLTLIYTLFLLVAFMGLGAILHGLFSHNLRSQLDQDIRANAQGGADWLKSEIAREMQPRTETDDEKDDDDGRAGTMEAMDFVEGDVYMELVDPHGQVLQASHNLHGLHLWQTGTIPPLTPGAFTLRRGASGSARCIAVPVHTPRGTYLCVAAKSAAGVDGAVQMLDRVFLIAIPLVLLLAAAGGTMVTGRALKPIAAIAATARAIASGDLQQRIHPTGPHDELWQLGTTFDDMIAAIENLMATQRHFFTDASHELRTPLTVILGVLEVNLRVPKATPAQLREAMETARDEARHMKHLVDDLMTLSRADAGQQPLRLSSLDLSELLTDAAESARWMMGSRELRLDVQDGAQVQGDADRLRQLLLNLLSNAAHHTPADGTITLALRMEADEVLIRVSDNGEGIAPEHLERVFERFYRADPSRSQDSGGSGLGLAICRWIADAHGGSLSAESEVGVGTTVLLRLKRLR